MNQIENNSLEQAMLGDFLKAMDDAVLDSSDVKDKLKLQYLTNPQLAKNFARVVFDMLTR